MIFIIFNSSVITTFEKYFHQFNDGKKGNDGEFIVLYSLTFSLKGFL